MRRKSAHGYDFRVRCIVFGNALGNSIVGAMQQTAAENLTAEIEQNLDQERQQSYSQINEAIAQSQQEFSDQVATDFDAGVDHDLDLFAAQQTERGLVSGAEGGFSSPNLSGLAAQAANVKFNVADPAEFNFLQASQALRRQQDAQAAAATGAKSAEVQAALERGNYSEVVRLTDESLRLNDPVGYALANQSQLAPSATTRALGAVQLTFGAVDIGVGAALSATGAGAILGVPLAIYGADQYIAGSRSLSTGYGADSGLYQAAVFAGVSPTVARDIEFGMGYVVGFGGVSALLSASRAESAITTSVLDDSVGAMRRREFEGADYHGKVGNDVKSRGPVNGQDALDNSVVVKPTSPRRVGIDYETGDFVVLDRTINNTYHGHVRDFQQLHPDMQRALINAGMVNKHGSITGGSQ
ncbi:MAG: Large exoprotein involved in heme utilization or adhesion [Hydrocarboniphaga sp.]|uniref:hypothetical protein n=1 Tax=Hydrocarboniphaga sp. TaxID=2033016 RepID=UPI002634FADD|nr:hypothetical protein [Hydrocarboniphaga sp.]MDB5971728.1 Large exoprotein involved in heme utilization or adhesion [Hydrocarboniphaga sp.]